MEQPNSDAIRTDLVTKAYLDIRLLQHTIANVLAFTVVAALLKCFTQ
jgi:hypothetical protein